jgi:hypothetical protein
MIKKLEASPVSRELSEEDSSLPGGLESGLEVGFLLVCTLWWAEEDRRSGSSR